MLSEEERQGKTGTYDITSGKYKASKLPSEEGQCYYGTQLSLQPRESKEGV